MKKGARFILLYFYSWYKFLPHINKNKPVGLHGSAMGTFVDIYEPEETRRPHGVIIFVIQPGETFDDFYFWNLFGPLGFTLDIDFRGWHLYGVDGWGCLDPKNDKDAMQIAENPILLELYANHPDCTFQIAGVRRFGDKHVWPLNDPSRFILKKK